MSVRVQVLDERGLPVHCTVAAVRTSDQSILALYDTDDDGVANIAESGTWYPRPMVTPSYKSRLRMVILNNQNSPCYDYVVDANGGGTHETLSGASGAFAAALAAGGNKAIWMCNSETFSREEEVGGLAGTISISGHGASPGSGGGTVSAFARIVLTAASNSNLFKQTTSKSGTSRGVTFRGVGVSGGSAKGVLSVQTGTEIDFIEFFDCWLAFPYVVVADGALNGIGNLAIHIERCGGSLTALWNCTTFAGGPDRLRAMNNVISFATWWAGSGPDSVQVSGGEYTQAAVQELGGISGFKLAGITLRSSVAGDTFTVSGTTQNGRDVSFKNIEFVALNDSAKLGNFASAGVNPCAGLFFDSINAYPASGFTPSGNFITVDANWNDVHVGDVYARGWSASYSGPAGVGDDHGNLVGLDSDDHTQYLLADGSRIADKLEIDDANFALDLISSNPRITFASGDFIEYDRANNLMEFYIGSTRLGYWIADGISDGLTLDATRLTIIGALGMNAFQLFVTGDTNTRMSFTTQSKGGRISFGPGNAATDVNLDRNVLGSTPVLATTDLQVTSRIWFATSTWITGAEESSLILAHWGHATVLIDQDNNDTSRLFRVMHNGNTIATATELFRIDEAGKATLAGELEVNGNLNHDGSNIGFFGVTPAARAAAYTLTNVSTDRAFDADSTSLDEVADVLGTLIADLKTYGLLQ